MFVEFIEIITGGIQVGTKRPIVINLDKVITFRGVDKSNGGTKLETRRGDVYVDTSYDEVKKLFNTRNGVPPVLVKSWGHGPEPSTDDS
tara:strand:- start:1792 stop:2058 length:267 start_codon:yes stop_codon:yes gene_type:complete